MAALGLPRRRVSPAGTAVLGHLLDGRLVSSGLAWPALKVALEYDGVEFHTGSALTAARARRNALTAEGWTLLSVTAPMLWRGRAALIELVRRELRRAELSSAS